MLTIGIITLILFPVLLLFGTGWWMTRMAKKSVNQAQPEPLRNIILPSSIQNPDDLVWFETVMAMAGMEDVPVISTCDCGFAEECYMHCNHDLNDGKCTGHAYKPLGQKIAEAPSTSGNPYSGRFVKVGKNTYGNASLEPAFDRIKVKASPQTPELMSWQEKRARDEAFGMFGIGRPQSLRPRSMLSSRRFIDKRNAKMKAEFEATKKVRGTPFEEMNALRHRMDDRQREISELKRQLKEIAVKPPKPQYISQPTTYDPISDCYTVYGRKISRHMLEDLIYNGGLTPQQVREIIAPEAEYETVMLGDGTCYDIRVR